MCQKLQRTNNDIRVPSFILSGAPVPSALCCNLRPACERSTEPAPNLRLPKTVSTAHRFDRAMGRRLKLCSRILRAALSRVRAGRTPSASGPLDRAANPNRIKRSGDQPISAMHSISTPCPLLNCIWTTVQAGGFSGKHARMFR